MVKPLKSEIIAWNILKRGTLTQPVVVSFGKENFHVSKLVVLVNLQLFLCHAVALVVRYTDHLEELGFDVGFCDTCDLKEY